MIGRYRLHAELANTVSKRRQRPRRSINRAGSAAIVTDQYGMKASRVYRGFLRLAYVAGALVYVACLMGFLAYAVDQHCYLEPLKWAMIVAPSAAAVCMGCIMLLAWIVAAFGEPGGEPKLSILGNPVVRIAAGLGFWGLWWEAMDVAGRWVGELLGGLVVLSLIGIAVAIARPAAQPPGDEQANHAAPVG
jgi:hypothetical protein